MLRGPNSPALSTEAQMFLTANPADNNRARPGHRPARRGRRLQRQLREVLDIEHELGESELAFLPFERLAGHVPASLGCCPSSALRCSHARRRMHASGEAIGSRVPNLSTVAAVKGSSFRHRRRVGRGHQLPRR
ncbi:hypothetical protein HBB16_13300 [Pseudonocardia sp. MCCB 268]|nr:hypothetical protein [Pseudonocardia cytotoxica]